MDGQYFLQICDHIKNNTPDDDNILAGAFYNVANEYSRNGDYRSAIQLYEESLRYFDKDPSVYNNMGSCYKYVGQGDAHENMRCITY